MIFLSAKTDVRDKEAGFAAGGSDYVTKPFPHGEVKARVSVHLQLRRTQRELAESHEQLHASRQLEVAAHKLKKAKEKAEAASIASRSSWRTCPTELRTPLHGILSFSSFGINRHASAEPRRS